MNINEFLNPSVINDDMDDMDMSMNNFENSDLMFQTSDFFNSILPFEPRSNTNEEILNFDDDLNIFSNNIHIDDVLSPKSYSSESEPISDQTSVSSLENVDDLLSSKLNNSCELDDDILISLLNPVTNNEKKKAKNLSTNKIQSHPVKATKILIQNPTNKKFISKPIINAAQWKRSSTNGTKSQILRVQKVSNNGRSVLLPLSVQNLKFLNASTLNNTLRKTNIETIRRSVPSDDDTDTVSSSTNNNNLYQPLGLTSEEKRLLAKEGITLPTHHPLTKNEERELKRIRRKIRNKISAQDSRKRKKEYVDGLEERVKKGSEENKNLIQRVKELQRENKTLIAHVNKLQALIRNSTTTKANPSTCLMVVLLSALLVSLPNMKLFEKQNGGTTEELSNIRRSLLSSQQTADDDINMDEFLLFKDGTDTTGDVSDIENITDKDFVNVINEIDQNYDQLMYRKNNMEKKNMFNQLFETMNNLLQINSKDKILETKPPDIDKQFNKIGFVEPDIDEYLPSAIHGVGCIDTSPIAIKKRRLNDAEITTTTTTINISEKK